MPKSNKTLIAALVALSVCYPGAALAELTFAQYLKGPPKSRAFYTSGVVDTVGVYTEVLGFVDRWAACLSKLKLSTAEVMEAAEAYARIRPIMYSQPAPAVIIVTLNQLCGFNLRAPQ